MREVVHHEIRVQILYMWKIRHNTESPSNTIPLCARIQIACNACAHGKSKSGDDEVSEDEEEETNKAI